MGDCKCGAILPRDDEQVCDACALEAWGRKFREGCEDIHVLPTTSRKDTKKRTQLLPNLQAIVDAGVKWH